ncbi:hypothetical protein [Streptomyces sp. NPDC002690]
MSVLLVCAYAAVSGAKSPDEIAEFTEQATNTLPATLGIRRHLLGWRRSSKPIAQLPVPGQRGQPIHRHPRQVHPPQPIRGNLLHPFHRPHHRAALVFTGGVRSRSSSETGLPSGTTSSPASAGASEGSARKRGPRHRLVQPPLGRRTRLRHLPDQHPVLPQPRHCVVEQRHRPLGVRPRPHAQEPAELPSPPPVGEVPGREPPPVRGWHPPRARPVAVTGLPLTVGSTVLAYGLE